MPVPIRMLEAYWRFNGLDGWPPMLETAAECFFGAPRKTRDAPNAAAICCLLNGCSPTAVIRFVVASPIYPIERMLGARFFSHVREKVIKTSPALVHRNSSRAVPFERGTPRFGTSDTHRPPSGIGRRGLDAIMGVASMAVPFLCHISFIVYPTTQCKRELPN